MNNAYREDSSCCYFHPKEVVMGVCHLCLHERLVIIAAKQGHNHRHARQHQHHLPSDISNHKKSPINLPKMFALGSLLNRLEFRHWKLSDNSDKSHVSSSPEEDSFISIKFEDNGAASWEKSNSTVSKPCVEKQCSKPWINIQNPTDKESKQDDDVNNDKKTDMMKETMSVIEHAKPRAVMRWRKRIGHLFQVIKLKRSSKGTMCHVGAKVEGVKVMRKGWIRSLTKRRTKQ